MGAINPAQRSALLICGLKFGKLYTFNDLLTIAKKLNEYS